MIPNILVEHRFIKADLVLLTEKEVEVEEELLEEEDGQDLDLEVEGIIGRVLNIEGLEVLVQIGKKKKLVPVISK
eukprot:CAMPEP_0204821548 /NCGR_PEP_ID=MMETSP1018-20131115/21898_1 /ASSEMBLY_ACC=CAM_ASM_000518 /TAXON_ID=46462 /ORGANISM="Anophryoides haemophila, Strain AH6" /LENGTH=74 /DNA_ID=CAMNT_0051935069 /DNA_START=73 /DNA_END=297 /DNA_ORIENTATION=-